MITEAFPLDAVTGRITAKHPCLLSDQRLYDFTSDKCLYTGEFLKPNLPSETDPWIRMIATPPLFNDASAFSTTVRALLGRLSGLSVP